MGKTIFNRVSNDEIRNQFQSGFYNVKAGNKVGKFSRRVMQKIFGWMRILIHINRSRGRNK